MNALLMRQVLPLLILFFISPISMSATINDHYFYNRDGLRLHYLEAGQGTFTVVFIPGWLMPASVFRLQLETLGSQFRVLAFDPRSQGQSEIYYGSHTVMARMNDMEDFLRAAQVHDYVLAGWSLGVLESLDFIEHYPQKGLRGLVLIDNSIGAGKPPAARSSTFFADLASLERRKQFLTTFTENIFKKHAPEVITQAAVSSVLQVPVQASIQLISQPYPRSYWRDIVFKQSVPVLYIIRPHLREQGDDLLKNNKESAQVEIFSASGHAMFVDDPQRFNSLVASFIQRSFTGVPQ
jgi:microsomal epoxide hydrolase